MPYMARRDSLPRHMPLPASTGNTQLGTRLCSLLCLAAAGQALAVEGTRRCVCDLVW